MVKGVPANAEKGRQILLFSRANKTHKAAVGKTTIMMARYDGGGLRCGVAGNKVTAAVCRRFSRAVLVMMMQHVGSTAHFMRSKMPARHLSNCPCIHFVFSYRLYGDGDAVLNGHARATPTRAITECHLCDTFRSLPRTDGKTTPSTSTSSSCTGNHVVIGEGGGNFRW
jgi:hypothetical protein